MSFLSLQLPSELNHYPLRSSIVSCLSMKVVCPTTLMLFLSLSLHLPISHLTLPPMVAEVPLNYSTVVVALPMVVIEDVVVFIVAFFPTIVFFPHSHINPLIKHVKRLVTLLCNVTIILIKPIKTYLPNPLLPTTSTLVHPFQPLLGIRTSLQPMISLFPFSIFKNHRILSRHRSNLNKGQ